MMLCCGWSWLRTARGWIVSCILSSLLALVGSTDICSCIHHRSNTSSLVGLEPHTAALIGVVMLYWWMGVVIDRTPFVFC